MLRTSPIPLVKTPGNPRFTAVFRLQQRARRGAGGCCVTGGLDGPLCGRARLRFPSINTPPSERVGYCRLGWSWRPTRRSARALPRILVQQPVRQMLAHLPIYALLPSSEQCASRRAFDDVGVPKSRLMAPLRPGKTRNTSASMDGNETPHLFPVSADLLFLYVYVGDQQVAEWYRVPVVHVDM